MSDADLAGGCLCGAVRIVLSGAPYRVGIVGHGVEPASCVWFETDALS